MKTNNPPIYFDFTSVKEQVTFAHEIKKNSGVLITEWVAPSKNNQGLDWFTLYLEPKKGLRCIQSTLDSNRPALFDLSSVFPVCNRLQRSIYEMMRIPTKQAKDKRHWLNHGNFPIGILNHVAEKKMMTPTPYKFKLVAGTGVHEIPVGPVHAGIIEPGHFRFSVVGEHILKLELQLGYAHKGIHALLKNKPIEDAKKIIGRVSGDSTVAYALAFATACENARDFSPSAQVNMERAILLERERLMNHIGDIGSIINDTGMPSIQSLLHVLKETLARGNASYIGHRYAMDVINPFEKNSVINHAYFDSIITELNHTESELMQCHALVDAHHGVQDRLQETGIITTQQAIKLGLLGVPAKASGVDKDIRRLFPGYLYSENSVTQCVTSMGDVAARVDVRFKESFESIALIKSWATQLKQLSSIKKDDFIHSEKASIGIGMVEGWRGPITVIVSIKNDVIEWCHFHDPSWQNWHAIDYAVLNNIVMDFPLINKSFNLSYSGHDA